MVPVLSVPAWQEGFNAYGDSEEQKNNPFRPETPRFYSWNAGWKTAERHNRPAIKVIRERLQNKLPIWDNETEEIVRELNKLMESE